jgi:hypothetical protein
MQVYNNPEGGVDVEFWEDGLSAGEEAAGAAARLLRAARWHRSRSGRANTAWRPGRWGFSGGDLWGAAPVRLLNGPVRGVAGSIPPSSEGGEGVYATMRCGQG